MTALINCANRPTSSRDWTATRFVRSASPLAISPTRSSNNFVEPRMPRMITAQHDQQRQHDQSDDNLGVDPNRERVLGQILVLL